MMRGGVYAALPCLMLYTLLLSSAMRSYISPVKEPKSWRIAALSFAPITAPSVLNY
jgi:hypothetical protein